MVKKDENSLQCFENFEEVKNNLTLKRPKIKNN